MSGIEVPPGVILFEDPPLHDLHRRLLSRVFTPRRMEAIEPLTRQFCVRALDPSDRLGPVRLHRGSRRRRFRCARSATCWASPSRTRRRIRDNTRPTRSTLKDGDVQGGARQTCSRTAIELFADYIDWRADHPSDDLMTQLLNAEIEEDGSARRLTRTEVLMYTSMIAGAGNETTTRLIGFIGQLLSEHPDQRRRARRTTPSLIPGAIEEVLRYRGALAGAGALRRPRRRMPRPDGSRKVR